MIVTRWWLHDGRLEVEYDPLGAPDAILYPPWPIDVVIAAPHGDAYSWAETVTTMRPPPRRRARRW